MKKALLLLGSPRQRGVSRLLGRDLLAGLAARGFEAESLELTGMAGTHEGRARLLGAFLGADLVVLAAPVFVDTLPAPVMRALEFLAGEGERGARQRRLAAVAVCGFPESSHTDVALGASRLFARDAGLAWAGGLGVGGAGAVDPARLAAGRGVLKNLRRALDTAAEALAAGQDIPATAVELAARPMMPRTLYLMAGEALWLAEAARRRALFRMGERPFRTP